MSFTAVYHKVITVTIAPIAEAKAPNTPWFLIMKFMNGPTCANAVPKAFPTLVIASDIFFCPDANFSWSVPPSPIDLTILSIPLVIALFRLSKAVPIPPVALCLAAVAFLREVGQSLYCQGALWFLMLVLAMQTARSYSGYWRLVDADSLS